MGLVKVKKLADGKVKFIHQLDQDGKAYAEDVTIEVQKGVPASRIGYFAEQDGKVGVINYGFTAYDDTEENWADLKFPED